MRHTERIPLLFSMAVAAALHFVFHTKWLPAFDDYWRLVVAEMQPWSQFVRELRTEEHPPLSYLLLRLASSAGDSLLWGRLTSIIPSILCLPVFFSILRRLQVPNVLAQVAVFGFGISHVYIAIGTSIRAYSLATLFGLIAVRAALDVVGPTQSLRRRHLAVFLAACVLAVWTHYSAVFLAVALTTLPILRAVTDAEWRGAFITLCKRAWPELVLALLGAILLGLYLYWGNHRFSHLGEHMPADGENPVAFFVRGLGSVLALFSALPRSATGPVVAVAWLATVFALILLFWRRHRARSEPGAFARTGLLLVMLVIMVELCAASLLERYPWGGVFRHQWVLFPFLLLWPVLILDLLAKRTGATAVAVVLLAGCLGTSLRSYAYERAGAYLNNPRAQTLNDRTKEQIASTGAVYMARLSQIWFYEEVRKKNGWTWKADVVFPDGSYVYRLEGQLAGNGARYYCDAWRWDIATCPTLADRQRIADLMTREKLARLTVYSRFGEGEPPEAPTDAERKAAWSEVGLRLGLHYADKRGEVYELRR